MLTECRVGVAESSVQYDSISAYVGTYNIFLSDYYSHTVLPIVNFMMSGGRPEVVR